MEVRRPTLTVWIVAATLATAGSAAAKPRPGGSSDDSPARDRPSVRQSPGRASAAESDLEQSVGAAFVADAALQGLPGSYGFAAAYRVRFTDVWGATAGTGVRFRTQETLVEPYIAGEATALETRYFTLAGGGGVAVPVTAGPGPTTAALALRASALVQYRWPFTDLVTPFAEATVVVGPVVTPAPPYDVHASVQLWIGAAFNI
jgi:hypothetical protein